MRKSNLLVAYSGSELNADWSKAKVKQDDKLKFKTEWTLHNIRRAVRIGPGKLGIIRKCSLITQSGHYAVPSEYSEAIALMAMYAAFIFQEPQW
jgi:hypothetical protein